MLTTFREQGWLHPKNGGKEIREKDDFGTRESTLTSTFIDSWVPPEDVPLFLDGVV
ncbi:hypothetical protein GCM10008022_34340 [Paenibacillus hunanensis]|nr:hypothetical protein GCM10008022_34340 [Paenibacillus hunanensis]